jgi:Helix-turn-helix domain
MAKKSLHPIFELLNFLSGTESEQYKLSSNEQLVLIFLCKHKGAKGIYPSLQTLAKETKKTLCAVRRSVHNLQQKKILDIEFLSGKSSNYTILIPAFLNNDTPSVDASTTNNKPLASTLVHPSRPRQYTPSVDASLSIQRNNNLSNTERGARKKLAPLPLNWLPDEKRLKHLHDTAAKAGLTAEALLTKFRNVQLTKDNTSADWQLSFENFLISERPTNLLGQFKPKQEVSSGLKFFDDPTHPNAAEFLAIKKFDEDRARERSNVIPITEEIKPHGGSENERLPGNAPRNLSRL